MALNAKMVKNNNVTFTITVKDNNDAVINITGYTVKYQIRQLKTAVVVITKSTGGNGVTIPTGTDGKFVVTLDDSDTLNVDPGTYIHEAVLMDTTGNYVTLTNDDDDLTYGTLTIREQYTAQ